MKILRKEREMTEAAVQTCSKVGKSCIYGCRLSGEPICGYILVEHHRRGCPPEACDKYVRKARGRKPGCMGS